MFEAGNAVAISLVAPSLGPLTPYGIMESCRRLRDMTKLLRQSCKIVITSNKIALINSNRIIQSFLAHYIYLYYTELSRFH